MPFRTHEAEVVLKNFAYRERVHKEKVINIRRLYSTLITSGEVIDRIRYDQVFLELEEAGYGTIGKSKQGYLEEFLPFRSIKQIGAELLVKRIKVVDVESKVLSKGLVTVYFNLNGARCKALIPEDAIDAFERMMYS